MGRQGQSTLVVPDPCRGLACHMNRRTVITSGLVLLGDSLAFTFNFRSNRNAKCSRSSIISVQRPGLEGLGRAREAFYMSRHSSLLDAEM
jgi:hypothetical protein